MMRNKIFMSVPADIKLATESVRKLQSDSFFILSIANTVKSFYLFGEFNQLSSTFLLDFLSKPLPTKSFKNLLWCSSI